MTPAKERALAAVRREREARAAAEVGSWWNPASPDDVRAEQKRADSARAALTTALQSKPPTGDPAQIDTTVRGWAALDAQVKAYVLEEPSFFWWVREDQLKRGQGLETQIETYRQQFERMGAGVPPAPAPPPSAPGPGDIFHDLTSMAQVALIAFLAFQFMGRAR